MTCNWGGCTYEGVYMFFHIMGWLAFFGACVYLPIYLHSSNRYHVVLLTKNECKVTRKVFGFTVWTKTLVKIYNFDIRWFFTDTGTSAATMLWSAIHDAENKKVIEEAGW